MIEMESKRLVLLYDLRYKAALAQEALGTFLRPVGGLAVTRFMRLLYFFGFYVTAKMEDRSRGSSKQI